MLILDREAVRGALPMEAAIEAMRQAFAALCEGRAMVPERIHLDVERHGGVTLVMPALVEGGEGALTVKVVSLFARNQERGLARLQAAVLALEPDTGRPLAVLEGATLTALRTGAACGLATDILARPNARSVAILGAGVQARTQLEAVCCVRQIERAWVFDVEESRARAFADEMAGQVGNIETAATAAEAVREADIVCAATTSATPVFADGDICPGTHINAIGSFKPSVQEIPSATVVRSLVVVDSREAALAETGDLLIPIGQGLMSAEDIHAELGELVLGRKPGRTSDDQVTLFKSVGIAVQDAVAATFALRRAREFGLGEEVRF